MKESELGRALLLINVLLFQLVFLDAFLSDEGRKYIYDFISNVLTL